MIYDNEWHQHPHLHPTKDEGGDIFISSTKNLSKDLRVTNIFRTFATEKSATQIL